MTDQVTISRELLGKAIGAIELGMCIQCDGISCCKPDSLTTLGKLQAALAAPAQHNEPVGFTTEGMIECIKALPFTGRIGVRAQKTARWNVALYLHPAPSVQDLVEALEGTLKVIDMLMPGVRYIAVQDYQTLNEAPIAARKAIDAYKGEKPCG